jgi:hypothetical protein
MKPDIEMLKAAVTKAVEVGLLPRTAKSRAWMLGQR